MAATPLRRQPPSKKVEAAFCINEKGSIASINSGFKDILGCDPEELIGKPFRQMVSQYLQGSKSSTPASFTIDCAPVHTSKGTILEIVLKDVSSGRPDEPFSQLAHRLFEESSDHISIVGKDYRYLAVNPSYEFHHGYLKNHIIGRHVAEILGEQAFVEIVKPHIDRCLAGENVRYRAWFNFKKTGRRFMFVSYFPLPSENGEIERIAVVSRDMTDVEALEHTILSIQELLQYKQKGLSVVRIGKFRGEDQVQDDPSLASFATLTSRQKQVVALIAQGKTNKEIAAEFSLSEKTVRNLLTGLFKKLRIARRTEAVALFARGTFMGKH